MNLLSKFFATVCAVSTSVFMTGCDAMFHDDLSDCPQGVYVKLYNQTPCASVPSYFEKFNQLHLFAFDQQGRLAGIHEAKDVVVGENDSILMPLKSGIYSFMAWSGVTDPLLTSKFTVGETTKKDLMFELPAVSGLLPQLKDTKLYHGQTEEVVELPNVVTEGSVFKSTSINLLNKMYRVNFVIKIAPSLKYDITEKDLTLRVTTKETAMNINGTMPLGRANAYYPLEVSYGELTQKATLNIMDITKTGFDTRVIIFDEKQGKELLNLDLLGTILINRVTKQINPNLNLDCQDEVDVELLIRNPCDDCAEKDTYVCYQISVANWVVHSYRSPLGF